MIPNLTDGSTVKYVYYSVRESVWRAVCDSVDVSIYDFVKWSVMDSTDKQLKRYEF